jgi:hypothetical protein
LARVLTEGLVHATQTAADLEKLLTMTGAAQVTQAELNSLETQAQTIHTAAQAALARTHELGES